MPAQPKGEAVALATTGAPRRTKRRLRASALVAATAAAVLALTACGGGSEAKSADGKVELRFAWWGGDKRAQVTQAAIAAFEAENPNIKIKPEYGDWSGYWDKLATQVAANDAPDIIQMDEKYITEYSTRGALLDLSKYKIDTSKLDAAALDAGKSEKGLTGIAAGINAATILANPAVFKAAGVALPDDKTWTWEDFERISAEVTAKSPKGTYGAAAYGTDEASLGVWLRQNGKSLYTDDGKLGFEPSDIAQWWSFLKELSEKKAVPSASEVVEAEAAPLDQSGLATGKNGLAFWWSNQLPALEKAAGGELQILRFPSKTGKAADAKLWYKASQFWSASSRTKHPEETAKFIDFLTNNVKAGEALLADRGVYPNSDVRDAIAPKLAKADVKVVTFIDQIKGELGDAPAAPPKGAGAIQEIVKRYTSEVLFNRLSTDEAGKKAVDEMKSAIS
ncbi:extracellular solute-binding protein [Paenarthrobacter sp. AR 02]|uniref:ABC transporter substrate-binding protein n=1 Tax=Micrococcaceae TaxID=1268 RepID=UPI001F1AEA12|nr:MULTISPECIES: extracellular solute-binding protein [Micrococcaceae]MCF3138072.1 extracellular solute-binding protein [Paenarthrobacter sp. AR 02]MCR1163087.1 extracellular solute-binding protein [Paenarthrobacter sp. UW852]